MTAAIAPRAAIHCGPIYARKGEQTLCSKGHVLGTLTRDVMLGASPVPDDVVMAEGMFFGRQDCPVCAAPVCAGPGIYFFREREG